MKISKKWLYIAQAGLLVSVLSSTSVSATDLLKLDSFNASDQPSYGENIVVIQNEEGTKGITAIAGTTGKINIPIILSTGEFTFSTELFEDSRRRMRFFFTLDEINLSFSVQGRIGFTSLEDGSFSQSDAWQKDGKNIVRIEVSNGNAKLYVNEIFIEKITLSNDKFNVLYDTLLVTNVDDDRIIYNMELTGGVSGSKFAAKISGDLFDLHIPLVNYKAPNGNIPFWANMKLYPNQEGKILFELTDYGVISDKR